ncbi:MAG: glycine zipper 2TM domain-containing protein [Desulfobacterales bacterium]
MGGGLLRNRWFACVMLLVALSAFSCAPGRSGKTYGRDQAAQSLSVFYGTVLRVEPVAIEGTRSGAGAAGGGVAGGFAGSTIGRGAGSTLGAVAGALAGAAIGAVTEEGLTRRQGLEIEVELDSGELLVVVQEADQSFAVGDRVRVIRGRDGSSRIRQ